MIEQLAAMLTIRRQLSDHKVATENASTCWKVRCCNAFAARAQPTTLRLGTVSFSPRSAPIYWRHSECATCVYWESFLRSRTRARGVAYVRTTCTRPKLPRRLSAPHSGQAPSRAIGSLPRVMVALIGPDRATTRRDQTAPQVRLEARGQVLRATGRQQAFMRAWQILLPVVTGRQPSSSSCGPSKGSS